jgi:ferritin
MATNRINFSDECETLINQIFQKQVELSYRFLPKINDFAKADVGLQGFAAWAGWMSETLWTWARQLMAYQNLRGGSMSYQGVSKPTDKSDQKPQDVLDCCLDCLKQLHQSYVELSKKALQQGDGQTFQFVEKHLINQIQLCVNFVTESAAKLKAAGGQEAVGALDYQLRMRFKNHAEVGIGRVRGIGGIYGYDSVQQKCCPFMQVHPVGSVIGNVHQSGCPYYSA